MSGTDARLDGDRLVATRRLAAPVERVWQALTTPRDLAVFWGGDHATVPPGSVTVDLRVGGTFALATHAREAPGPGRRLVFRYELIEPPTLLVLREPTRLDVVDRYLDGFRRSDHAAVLACLTDDVVWRVHGVRTTHGLAEFDDEIENPDFEGSPQLSVDRTQEAGDVVVVTGTGIGRHRVGGPFTFVYCDLFTFRGDLVRQVDSYVVPLPGEPGV